MAGILFLRESLNDKRSFVFVDGGVTCYNNPAFQLFLMATTEPYNLNWPVGENKMLLVSVGTGLAPNPNENLKPREMNILYNATSLPSALIYASQVQQDFLCRVFGNCLAGDDIDREIGNMINKKGPGNSKLFTYVRYNAELSKKGLETLGLTNIEAKDVQPMDSVGNIDKLQEVGKAIADKQVKENHFKNFGY